MKKLSDEDLIRRVFMAADRQRGATLLMMAQTILAVRFPEAPPAVKRKKKNGEKPPIAAEA